MTNVMFCYCRKPTKKMITTLQWYNFCCLCARSRNRYTTTAICCWFPCMPLSNDVRHHAILWKYLIDIYHSFITSITLRSSYIGKHWNCMHMWEHALSSLICTTQFTCNICRCIAYSCSARLPGHVSRHSEQMLKSLQIDHM